MLLIYQASGSTTHVFNHMAMVADEDESTFISQIDLHSDETFNPFSSCQRKKMKKKKKKTLYLPYDPGDDAR